MSKRNQIITNLSFIGALLIVLLHLKPEATTHFQYLVVDFIYEKSGLLGIPVPLFFCISGFLLVGHVHEKDWWKSAVIKRLKTLIVPFYIWTFIYLIIIICLYAISLFANFQLVTPNPISNGLNWLLLQMLGLDVFHLTPVVWYLRSLFLYVLISPIIVMLLKKHTTIPLYLVLLVLYQYGSYGFTGIPLLDQFLTNGIYIRGALPFAIGINLRLNTHLLQHLRKLVVDMRSWGAVYCVVLFLRYFPPPLCTLITGYLISLLDTLFLVKISMKISLPSYVSELSMPLYLVHMLVKWLIAFLLSWWGVYNAIADSFYFWPLKYTIIVGVALSVSHLFKNRYPKIYGYLYGGR